MHLKETQQQVDQWISQYGGYWPPLSMLARLTEETGELARELNKVYGMKKAKPEEKQQDIEGEIGDLLITIICISNALKIDLETVFEKTMNKLAKRDSKVYQ